MNDPQLQQTIHTYDTIAADYAAETETYANYIERDIFQALLPPPAKILDVGCASGKDGAFFQSQGYKVIGIDLSPGLLAQAKIYHPKLKVKLMDMRQLDFHDHSFDGIWAQASLLHLDRKDLPMTLREFFRVLKPNGVCYVFVKAGRGIEVKKEAKSFDQWRHFTYFSLEEMEKYFTDAGFKIEKSYSYNGRSRNPASRDQNWIVIFGRKP